MCVKGIYGTQCYIMLCAPNIDVKVKEKAGSVNPLFYLFPGKELSPLL